MAESTPVRKKPAAKPATSAKTETPKTTAAKATTAAKNAPAATKPKAPAAEPKAAKAKTKTTDSGDIATTTDIANELGIPAAKVRRLLRQRSAAKGEEFRWGWTRGSKEYKAAVDSCRGSAA